MHTFYYQAFNLHTGEILHKEVQLLNEEEFKNFINKKNKESAKNLSHKFWLYYWE